MGPYLVSNLSIRSNFLIAIVMYFFGEQCKIYKLSKFISPSFVVL